MRHPALTRFFAAILAVMCLITLISGALCLKKAADREERQSAALDQLEEKTAKAKELLAELDAGCEQYDELAAEYDSLSESYSSDTIKYRADLALLTATEAGVKQGRAQLRTGLGAFYTAKAEYEEGLAAFNEAEAQFNEGYAEYLAGKEALAQAWEEYYAAEEYLASGVDIQAQRAEIQEGMRLCSELSAEIGALLDVLTALPADPESGGPSSEELSALIRQRAGAVLAGLADGAQIGEAAGEAYSAAEAMEKMEAVSGLLELAGEADGSEEELAAKLEAIRADADLLVSGELSDSEQLATTIDMLRNEKELCDYAYAKLSAADQMLAVLEELPAMKAQLDDAQSAMDEATPMMEETKTQMETGREQLTAAGEALKAVEIQLYNARVSLDEKEAELKETRAELEERRVRLEEDSARLEELDAEVGEYVRTRDEFSDLKYSILADEGVAARCDAGAELIPAAEAETAQRRIDTRNEHASRLLNGALMLDCAAAGLAAAAAAFKERRGALLIGGAALAFALAAASEALSVADGRGMLYTSLFVGVFALGVLLLNLKKA